MCPNTGQNKGGAPPPEGLVQQETGMVDRKESWDSGGQHDKAGDKPTIQPGQPSAMFLSSPSNGA